MYSNLWANTPRDIMTFADKPFPAGTPMFPFRTDILNYVKKYGEEIRHLVKFNMEVVNVEKRDNWCLTIQDLLHPAKCPTVQQFDAVAIASGIISHYYVELITGHYDVPMIPSISGINDYPKEKITHAKYFRHPSKYKGQNVLLVGNGPSGADLGNQLLHYARSVRRSVRSEPNFFAVTNALVQDIVPIERFTSTTIELIDRTSLTDIDVVIFCTGYLYSLPMFPKQAGFITPDGLYVHNLYQHTFYINDPTLIFMGLPKQIIPFPTFQNQSIVVAKVWAQKLHLPSKEEMSKEELTRLEQKGFQRAKYHSFKFPEDVELSDGWVKWIDKDKSPGRENRMKPWRWTEDALDLRKRAPEVKALFLKEVDEGKWDHYHLTQP